METVLRSASREVVIGPRQPFCIIGERINPTGRKIFQEQLRRGDLSRIEIDVAQQVAGGAMVLDVNMGAPLADEAELMVAAVKLIQGLTDLPLCIDSSIIEVLDAGLAAYQGKALVNSVTAEDERLEAILPLVKKYGAAVIALPNDEEEIPEDPRQRLDLARKIIDVATGRFGIPLEDIVIDPLAMPVGADTSLVRQDHGDHLAAARGVRGEHHARRVQRLVRHAGPARDRRGVPAHGHHQRADQRDPGRPRAADRPRRAGRRPAAGPGPLGGVVDRRAPGPAGRRRPRPRPRRDDGAARHGRCGRQHAALSSPQRKPPRRAPHR